MAETVDFAAVHVSHFLDTHYNPTRYDWRQKQAAEPQRAQAMVDATLAEAKLQFADSRKGLQKPNLGAMPMLIGETGWAAVDTAGGHTLVFRANPVNQKLYFDALLTWVAEGRRDTRARRPSSTSWPSTSPGSRATTAAACSMPSARPATRCKVWAAAA